MFGVNGSQEKGKRKDGPGSRGVGRGISRKSRSKAVRTNFKK